MIAKETKLKGCFILEPTIFEDSRGYFFESFNEKKFEEITGKKIHFVQDNESHSKKGVLRGLHYQYGDAAQAKLVRVLKGSVLDVAVDLRKKSPTFGQYESIILSEKNKKQFFIPRGFAHGFLVLEEGTLFNYKCDNFYSKASEKGVLYNDNYLNIDWLFKKEHLHLSEKDLLLPTFQNAIL